MAIISLDKTNLDEVISNNKKIIIDFWATWCSPCKIMSAILDSFEMENRNVVIGKINTEENMDLATQYGVQSIPTLLLFENGKLINTHVGIMDIESLERFYCHRG